jgi:hypothetical protein
MPDENRSLGGERVTLDAVRGMDWQQASEELNRLTLRWAAENGQPYGEALKFVASQNRELHRLSLSGGFPCR